MSVQIKVFKSKEFLEIERAFNRMAREGLRSEARRGLKKLGRETYETMKSLVPGSGRLARYIKYYVFSYRSGGPQSVRMQVKLRRPPKPYPRKIWDYIIGGTRPHPIVARRAKALHFYWDRLGREVFFKSVQHPGTKPYNFPRIALIRVREKYMDRTADGIARNVVASLEGRK